MKKALITGASRGIGAAAARALSNDGFMVYINYLNSEEKAFELARETGGRALRADVSDPAQVRAMFGAAGDIDVLVCNAGISYFSLFTDTTYDQWRRIFAVNADGTANCCREAIPAMVRKKSGRIITISSIWGVAGASCEAAYSASKAAVIGLTKALAKELGPSGITVNCIAPGLIDTDMNAALSDEDIKSFCGDTPLGAMGKPEDIAAAVSFLASDKAGFITGQILGVNGGAVI